LAPGEIFKKKILLDRPHQTQICQKGHAPLFQALPNIQFIYLDTQNECRFTYKIVISFDRKTIKPEDVKYYQVKMSSTKY
jgi:hypothetical protein